MSFFDPDLVFDDGSTYKSRRYKEILKEQVLISYISKGITIFDTDVVSPYDRKVILQTLEEIKEEEKRQMEEAIKK